MKTTFLIIVLMALSYCGYSQKEVSRITVGAGIGFNHLFQLPSDYSLTTDGSFKLISEDTNRNKLVVSPMLAFRLEKFFKDANSTEMFESNGGVKGNKAPWYDKCRFSLLLSVNLLDLKTENIAFNKNIDGGIGIGYAITTDIQIGLLYEFKNYRQLRNYITTTYLNAPIPNGVDSYYNALDEKDNNLFQTKTFEGFSIKLIFNASSL